MNERRALHPIYPLFGLLSTIKGFIPLIIIFLLRGSEWEIAGWIWGVGGGGLAAIILLFSYLDWKRFGFWLESDRIVIRKGVLFRDEKTIYYTRIHSVNVEQPLIQRLLNVAQVKIETPGGSKKADGILPALSVKEANRIQQVLREHAQSKAKPAPEAVAPAEPSLQDAEGAQDEGTPRVNRHVESLPEPSVSEAGTRGPAFRLSGGQLLQAALTSMNFGLVIAFIAGLYSFADDFIEMLLPAHFIDNLIEDSASLLPGYFLIIVLTLLGLGFAWLMSLVLYVLKYSGFLVERNGKQISVSYGLLEKKAFVFDQKNVQAVIVKEGLLRQAFGFAEIQLQVISSDKKEQLMLHPFVKRQAVNRVLEDFIPRFELPEHAELHAAPPRSLSYYVRIELLIAAAACTALIWWLGAAGWISLLLIPLMFGWGYSSYRAAGVLLKNGQLTMRKRLIEKSTYLLRRPQILTMRVKRSAAQERKRLLTLSVHVLGSQLDYKVDHLERHDIEPVWQWYSRSSGSRS